MADYSTTMGILQPQVGKSGDILLKFEHKNGGERGIRTLGDLRLGGFQDRCLKPLDHLSGFAKLLSDAFEHQFCHVLYKSCRVFNRTAF